MNTPLPALQWKQNGVNHIVKLLPGGRIGALSDEILAEIRESNGKLDAKIMAIHAGLECGLFLEKYPKLDMISFGPTLRDVHSPNERIEIATVGLWWSHLLELLKSIPATFSWCASCKMNTSRAKNLPPPN